MSRGAKRNLVSFIVGLLFALGLGVAGMTQPQKVIAFLDVRHWNPSLIFVMAGAIAVHGLAYAVIRKKSSPLLDEQWHIPTRKDITPRLMGGAALFGIGWGLGGFCPGPAITSLFSGDERVVAFVVAMLLGMALFIMTEKFLPSQQ